jgi:hypothetical protein
METADSYETLKTIHLTKGAIIIVTALRNSIMARDNLADQNANGRIMSK